jgi:hypothetical protein
MSQLSHLIYQLRNRGKTGLETVMRPHVRNDELQFLLEHLAADPRVRTILEIGSSDGRGSTAGIARGMKRNPSKPQLHALEFSKRRFERLHALYRKRDDIHCHNMATVSRSETLSPQTIIDFFKRAGSAVYGDGAPEAEREFIGLLDESNSYIDTNGLEENGLATVKARHGIDPFDLVFIDGGPFTGTGELAHSYGAKFIVLDDIFDLKNYDNHQRMMADSNYEMVGYSRLLRSGYSAFMRK